MKWNGDQNILFGNKSRFAFVKLAELVRILLHPTARITKHVTHRDAHSECTVQVNTHTMFGHSYSMYVYTDLNVAKDKWHYTMHEVMLAAGSTACSVHSLQLFYCCFIFHFDTVYV